MTLAAQLHPLTLHPAVRFLKTPKGLLLALLTGMTLIALSSQPFDDAAPAVLSAMAVAALLDMVIIWVMRSELEFPSGALLTGLIVGVILTPQESSLIVVAVAVIAIASKHVLRTKWSNIFNPAALALVASSFLFATNQSWWGSMPDLGPLGLVILCAGGLFIADRINSDIDRYYLTGSSGSAFDSNRTRIWCWCRRSNQGDSLGCGDIEYHFVSCIQG